MFQVHSSSGASLEFDSAVTAAAVIATSESIGKQAKQAAVGCKIDGVLCDLASLISSDCILEAVQDYKSDGSLDLDAQLLRNHSAAHVTAEALQALFPGVQLVYGPPSPNGFYYDVAMPPGQFLSSNDFPALLVKIRAIIAEKRCFTRYELSAKEGMNKLKLEGSKFKIDNAERALEGNPDARLSFYVTGRPGADFEDLCRGPHVRETSQIGVVHLVSVSSSRWHGDERSDQLTRINGVAFPNQAELDRHLKQLDEAKKRDHRVLGRELRLFTISSDAGNGLILWLPKGATIRGILENFIKDELIKRGYQPVYTPHIGRLAMYRTSGHFPYYREAQYPPMYGHPAASLLDLAQHRLAAGVLDAAKELEMAQFMKALNFEVPGYAQAKVGDEKLEAVHRFVLNLLRDLALDISNYHKAVTCIDRSRALLDWLNRQDDYLLKPMNCPHHIQIFKDQPRSYRELPVRLAEFGTVYRFEQSGELNGMTRVRGFTQDDAHLFITPDQVETELLANLDFVLYVLQSLGLTSYRVRVGVRDPLSNKYVGDPEAWAEAEKIITELVGRRGINYAIEKGEAAFYGPKIDFVVKDCIGREWQLGTVQLDYNLPKRFELEYIGADNKPHCPIMIHRAPFGSMERFMGILIEHFAGAFPLWLAPEQVRVLTISEKFNDYGRRVESELKKRSFRVASDFSAEKIGAKIRSAQMEKIPYMVVVGGKEEFASAVSVRDRIEGDVGTMSLSAFVTRLSRELAESRP